MNKKVEFTFRGLLTGVFTPFDEDLSVNTSIIPEYAKFLADEKILGVLVNGTTGEGPAMTVKERKKIAEAWASAVKQTNQHLMVQVGGCPLPDAQELARHAEKIGVDSLLCLPDLYFKPKGPQDLVDYLKLISEAASKTPLVFYHNPVRSGVDVNMEQFLNLSVAQIPTFDGVKYSLTDLSEAYNALKMADGRYTVFLADADTILQPALVLGFDSFSTASLNVFPGHHVKMIDVMKENKEAEARALQEKLTAVCKIISEIGDSVPTMKAAMNLLSPIKVGLARPPQKNPTESQQKELVSNLKKYVL